MSKQQRTPGPWFRDQYGHIYGTSEPRPLEGFPGGSVIDQPHVCTPKNPADIRLIAAAPELLEALVQCIDALDTVRVATGNTFSASDKARAAIAKATGA